MKETGIIMSGDHPKLILDEIKAMTRRTWGLEIINLHPNSWHLVWNEGDLWAFSNEEEEDALTLKCPYGGVGDRLWVRETHRLYFDEGYPRTARYFTDADNFDKGNLKWRPSIFMPRWASRILLEITGLRAERLQEISESDVISEGCPDFPHLFNIDVLNEVRFSWFKSLWDSLNAKRGYGWLVNPWVWVISFKVVEQLIDRGE